MKKEKSCGSIIINCNKVLLIKQHQGFYGFPKGHMETNETEEQTAIRETKEETNIDIQIIREYRYSNNYVINNEIAKEVIYFLATPLNTNIEKQSSEILDVVWINIDEVYDKLTYQDTKEMWIKVKKDIIKSFNKYI